MIKPNKNIEKMWRPDPDDLSRSDYLRLEKNERTTLFNTQDFNKIISSLTPYDLVAYGELEPFYKSVVNWLKLKRENILLTSGSDAAIRAVFETYISNNDEVIITLPNYAMFKVYAAMFGADIIECLYDKDFSLDIKKLINLINDKTRLIIISNPSHTGTVVEKSQLMELIHLAQKKNIIVLIDEAYHHFYPETMVNNIKKFDNLIVTRTFSKAFGLASIRVGILLSSKMIIDELYKVKLVHEITGVAAKIGCYFLSHLNILEEYINEVELGKIVLYDRLDRMGYITYKSEANFVFFKPPKNIDLIELKKFLEKRSILIRGPFINDPFDNHLRVTVGSSKQMNKFCDIILSFSNKN